MDYTALSGNKYQATQNMNNVALETTHGFKPIYHNGYLWIKLFTLLLFVSLQPVTISAQQLTDTYNAQRPVVIACDWDKPPYEFLNDQGQPDGSNIDVLTAIFEELDIPCRFVMKEWGNAIKTFERGEADLILANTRRYTNNNLFCWTDNIINYNRIVAATTKDSHGMLSIRRLVQEGVVLKPSDYTAHYFMAEDSTYLSQMEFQSPKVAIMGIVAGDYNYFLWGEEPIKWKLKELNIDNVQLREVNIPISEIHVIGRDNALITAIDYHYSNMKQRGELEEITNRWFHPERVTSKTSPVTLYIVIGVILLAAILYLAYRVSKTHARRVTRESTDLNGIIIKALQMENFLIMEYDIAADRMTNRYGQLLPIEGMTLQEFTSHIHPDEQQEFSHRMQRLLNGRDRKFEIKKRWASVSDASTVRTSSPDYLILEGHAIVELDEHGKPAYIVNAVHNITHDIEEERTTRETEKKYNVLSNIPLIATSFYDKEGYLTELNDAMKQLCGITDSNPNTERFWRKVSMFDIPLFRSIYRPEDRHDLYLGQHMDYPDMGINRYIEFFVHPLLDTSRELVGYFVSAIDVTDEYECSHQLRDNQRQQQQTDHLLQFYDQQLTQLVNYCKLYLWHSDIAKQEIHIYKSLKNQQLIVQNMDDFLSHIVPNEQDVAHYLLNNTSPEQPDINVVFHFDQPLSPSISDGSALRPSYQDSWYNIKATRGVLGHHGICYEITDIIKMRQELKEVTQRAMESNQLKSGFMASMTHELRTPLNAIMGFTDVLRVTHNPKDRTEYIRIVRNSCDMLVRLINDIFEASTITKGPDSIEPAKVDFAKSFSDICLMLEQRVSESQLTFIKDNPYDTFITTLDIGRIQQIITNFVTNAIKFTRQGHIKVGYKTSPSPLSVDSCPNEGLLIYCEDTGSGIPADKQEIIFERFVKLDEYVQGTGLGLNICKSIAERCHGHIGVNSEGEGKGSTFWVWIPCEQQQ